MQNSSDSVVTKFCPGAARLRVVCVSQLPKVLMEKLSTLTVNGLGEAWITEALGCMQVQLQFSVAVKVKVKTDCATAETMTSLLGMSLAAELDFLKELLQ